MERWNGIVECVLQGAVSHETDCCSPVKLLLSLLGNKGPEGSLHDHSGPWWHVLEG